MIDSDKVVIVDEFTGRMMKGRRLSDGLHQAIEAKEGVQIKPENVTYASVTFNFVGYQIAWAGMNEAGLVMGLANVTPQPYTPDPSKRTLHFCLWVRKVLDECRTVDEAAALTRRYNILSSGSTLDVHAMVADASGHSLILEPAQGEMKEIPSQGPFQVMTNSAVYQVPLETQLSQCPRFRYIHETLAAADGGTDAAGCWDILRQVGNVWTEWSAVYGISAGSAALAIDFDFDPLYDFAVWRLAHESPGTGRKNVNRIVETGSVQ